MQTTVAMSHNYVTLFEKECKGSTELVNEDYNFYN